MAIASLKDLFVHYLRDIYYAERRLVDELPKMASQAGGAELRTAFQKHLTETKEHVEQLKRVFASIKLPASGEQCDALEGILKESDKVLSEIEDDATRDVALIASAQAVEHYEINRYGSLITWAEDLGFIEAAKALRDNMKQEKQADRHLSEIAAMGVNKKAA
ncbi:MAG TPA: ferritin-like domain-containing protein [Aestuariivirgaceae bacterium]|jgi:ferritin-like metal-binding protein YciE